MLHPHRLYFYNLLMLLIPETSCFALKRGLLRWCGAKVGSNVRICSSARFYGISSLTFGENIWVGSGTVISASAPVTFGSRIDISGQVYIGTGTHKIDPVGLHSAGEGVNLPITIGDGAWLCARSMVLPGVSVGGKTVVGAGAVVLKDLPSRCVAVGIPARIQRTF